MYHKFSHWFRALSATAKVIIVTLLSVTVLGATINHATKPSTTNLTPAKSTVTQAAPADIKHQTLTTTEEIPFATNTVDDSSLAAGTNQVAITGSNGVRTHTYDVTYVNGIESTRKELSSTVTAQPVTQVVRRGTYVAPAPQSNCPNGTYVNSAGNTVCSPYDSPSAPAGATARCADGSYSFSQNRSGTCSHHGGVANWL